MVNKPIDSHQRLEDFLQAVEVAQQLQNNILKYGLGAAYLYYEDVDGDWLEKWGDEDTLLQRITTFLESDDSLAIKVRELLTCKSIPEIASQLEASLNYLEKENKVFAIKDILVSNLDSNQNFSSNQGINLLEIAEELLEKFTVNIDM
ncbi:MAG: hypothetical protein IGS39_23645 [Calothrix sp. C42_A2020_038]|nr:hypothetical protein [Calothrix sp. C42_A2020_038]